MKEVHTFNLKVLDTAKVYATLKLIMTVFNPWYYLLFLIQKYLLDLIPPLCTISFTLYVSNAFLHMVATRKNGYQCRSQKRSSRDVVSPIGEVRFLLASRCNAFNQT